ncbi:ABC transporter permease [Bradyrhizobium sp. LHD-71]|uniref:ABC transporter permease n=1 Tax=Bradyrhizobium sp. LHD-71 TaxID=3072141 RepID=UPI00280D1D06|nr:ABC transporter permease [Bradyrhizobium sp. LHD-71]MDQ8732346.1 ABC transporter permease [Bradyrhizobium sp. LHD-71]
MKQSIDIGLRLVKALGQALGIVVLVFFLSRIVPGDTVDMLAAQGDLTESQQQAMRHSLGLDRSAVQQFVSWAAAAAHGDFGESLRFKRPVADMLATALPTTLVFAGLSFLVGVGLAFGLAVGAVMTQSRAITALVDAVNVWSIALPTFCVGVVGILVLSVWLGWLPVLGGMLLPVLIIGIDSAGQMVKPLHEELREAATSAHVRTARAKGVSALRVALVHLLPAALPVALALSGLVLAGLVAGTLTMEVLFGLPGIGSLTLSAIHGRDYPVIQAAIVVIAVALVAINSVIDILHRLIDPRLAT